MSKLLSYLTMLCDMDQNLFKIRYVCRILKSLVNLFKKVQWIAETEA